MDVEISPNHNGSNACLISFFPYLNTAYVFSDDLSSWGPVVLGSYDIAGNSQCYVIGNQSTYASLNNTTADLTLELGFLPPFVGTNYFDEQLSDQLGGVAAWGTLPGTLTVTGPPVITTDPLLPPGILSTAYSTVFVVQGGQPPYTWSVQTGTLPAGLQVSSNGTLSGTPGVSGNFSPVITVTDSMRASATLQASLTIAASSQTDSPPASPDPQFLSTKVGVFRGNAAFLEDSNGNGMYDAGTDRYIPSFTGPGGFRTGDVPVVGDWTGDHKAKVGIYRASTGQWFLDANNDGVFNSGDYTYAFGGLPGDMPFVGDWNGVGRSCVGLVRNSGPGTPYFYWVLDLNCNGTFDGTPTDAAFPFGGLAGDVPVVGKWTGQNTRVGVVRKYAPGGVPQGNPFFWVIDGGAANAGNLPSNHPAAANCFPFGGLAGDVFVTGDWYDTGTSGAGVYRAGLWVLDAALPRHPLASHVPGVVVPWGGIAGDVPVTGTWTPPPTEIVPTSLSLTPSINGPADSATFAGQWSDPSGDATNIKEVQIGFQTPPGSDYNTTLGGCAVQYYPPAPYNQATAEMGTLYLGDAASSQTFPYSSGIASNGGLTLSNGVCQIDTANTHFAAIGDVATLTMPVTFINSQGTTYSMFTSANDAYGYDNWYNFGTWTAPAVQLISNSLTVNGGALGGTGSAATFTAVFTDAAGTADIRGVDIAFSILNYGVTNAQGCHIQYIAPNLLLYSATAGDSSYTSSPLGASGYTLFNGVCNVDASLSSVTPSGNTLTLSVYVTVWPTTVMQYWVYSSLTGSGGSNGWVKFGTWTAPVPPTGQPGQPGSMTAAPPVLPCTDITGNWIVDQGGEWDLKSDMSGTLYVSNDPQNCGVVTYTVTGQLNTDGSITLTAQSPSQTKDRCGNGFANTITAQVTLSGNSCSVGTGGACQAL